MPNDSLIGQENFGQKPFLQPIVRQSANTEAASRRKIDAVETERIEHGHENIRKDAFAAVLREIDESRGVIVLSADAKREIAKIIADFAIAVLDLDAKQDLTLPVTASVEGYKKSLEAARKNASDRIRKMVSDSWEKYES